jgi:hypothetical protein
MSDSKGGRPKLPPKRKRSVAVKLWLSPGEAALIKEKAEAHELPLAAYVRGKALA